MTELPEISIGQFSVRLVGTNQIKAIEYLPPTKMIVLLSVAPELPRSMGEYCKGTKHRAPVLFVSEPIRHEEVPESDHFLRVVDFIINELRKAREAIIICDGDLNYKARIVWDKRVEEDKGCPRYENPDALELVAAAMIKILENPPEPTAVLKERVPFKLHMSLAQVERVRNLQLRPIKLFNKG